MWVKDTSQNVSTFDVKSISSSFLNNWYDGRYVHIFQKCFPELKVLITKFVTLSTSSWVSGNVFWRLGILIFEVPYCPNYIARKKRVVSNSS